MCVCVVCACELNAQAHMISSVLIIQMYMYVHVCTVCNGSEDPPSVWRSRDGSIGFVWRWGLKNPLALGYRRSQLGVCTQEHSGGRKEKKEEEEEQEEQEEEKEEKDHIGFNCSLCSAPRGLLDQSTYICNRSSNLNTSVMISIVGASLSEQHTICHAQIDI